MKGRETNEKGGEGGEGKGRGGEGKQRKGGGEGGEEKGRDWPAHLFEPSAAYVIAWHVSEPSEAINTRPV
jgi:hypothetical protein